MKIDQLLIGAVLSLLAAMVPASAQTYSFDPTGSTNTSPVAINPSGTVTGYYRDAAGYYHGFVRMTNGTIVPFDPTGSIDTVPGGINASGTVMGYYRDSSGVNHGFVASAPYASANIVSFDPTGSTGTLPDGINTS